MTTPSIAVKSHCNVDKPLRVKELFDFLKSKDLKFEIIKGFDAAVLAEDLDAQGIAVDYPWQAQIIGPTKYTGEFEGDQISHFIVVAEGLVVWAVFGSSMSEGEPDYELDDWTARLK